MKIVTESSAKHLPLKIKFDDKFKRDVYTYFRKMIYN